MTMRYKDSPEPPPPGMVPAGWDTKIMHTCVRIGDAHVMASDGCSEGPHFQGFALSLTAANAAEVRETPLRTTPPFMVPPLPPQGVLGREAALARLSNSQSIPAVGPPI